MYRDVNELVVCSSLVSTVLIILHNSSSSRCYILHTLFLYVLFARIAAYIDISAAISATATTAVLLYCTGIHTGGRAVVECFSVPPHKRSELCFDLLFSVCACCMHQFPTRSLFLSPRLVWHSLIGPSHREVSFSRAPITFHLYGVIYSIFALYLRVTTANCGVDRHVHAVCLVCTAAAVQHIMLYYA